MRFVRRALGTLKQLVVDPAGYSARWYRAKNQMDLAAVRPDRWRRRDLA